MGIKVISPADEHILQELNVYSWPTWQKEPSSFDWYYDSSETCYLLEGKVTVTPEGSEAVTFSKGDLVTFPAGMHCSWVIHEKVNKHFNFA